MSELLNGFGLGLLNMVNPCVLPLFPAFVAYLAGNQSVLTNRRIARWLGLIALLGVLTAMLAIGLILAVLKIAVGPALAIVLPPIYLIVIGMGVLLIVHRNPFERISAIRAPVLQNPILSSYLYGLLYAPMVLPCCGPLVVGVFAYGAADPGTVINGALYFVAFGLGFGLPLLILPLLAESVRKPLLGWMLAHHAILERAAGVLLIAIGAFGLFTDWDLIQHYWFGANR